MWQISVIVAQPLCVKVQCRDEWYVLLLSNDCRIVTMAMQPYNPYLWSKNPLMFDTNPCYLLQSAPVLVCYLILCSPSSVPYSWQATFICCHHSKLDENLKIWPLIHFTLPFFWSQQHGGHERIRLFRKRLEEIRRHAEGCIKLTSRFPSVCHSKLVLTSELLIEVQKCAYLWRLSAHYELPEMRSTLNIFCNHKTIATSLCMSNHRFVITTFVSLGICLRKGCGQVPTSCWRAEVLVRGWWAQIAPWIRPVAL